MTDEELKVIVDFIEHLKDNKINQLPRKPKLRLIG